LGFRDDGRDGHRGEKLLEEAMIDRSSRKPMLDKDIGFLVYRDTDTQTRATMVCVTPTNAGPEANAGFPAGLRNSGFHAVFLWGFRPFPVMPTTGRQGLELSSVARRNLPAIPCARAEDAVMPALGDALRWKEGDT